MRNTETKLAQKHIAIVSHIFSSGPALELEEYLHTKVASLLFIGHPFPFRKDTRSFYRYYQNKKKKKEYYSFYFHAPSLLFYLRDIVLTFWWVITTKDHLDLYIGSDGLVAYIGLLLKKLGKVDEVIFYTIDYAPNRFSNPVLNAIYHFLDTQCLKQSKIVWNVSPNMSSARKSDKSNSYAKQIVVPLGVWFDRIPKLPLNKKRKFQLVFMGHILEKQGVSLVISSLPILIKKMPALHLVIIGTGEFESNLKNLVDKLQLQKYVTFKGYIKDHKVVEQEIAKSTLGLAMYKPEKDNYTYFADPGKLKNYLAAGIPVILTDVPPIAKQLKKEKCGIIAQYNKKDFSQKVTEILQNHKKMQLYRKNAIRFAKAYDWNNIFFKALMQSL